MSDDIVSILRSHRPEHLTEEETQDAADKIEQLRDQLTTKDRQIAELQRLCERAYIELHANFDRLTDEEGYGPQNLVHDLLNAADGKEHRELQTLNDELGRALSEALAERDEARAEQQADERELSAMQFVVERALNYCERQALGRDPKPGDLTLTELERLCRHALNKPTEGLDHD